MVSWTVARFRIISWNIMIIRCRCQLFIDTYPLSPGASNLGSHYYESTLGESMGSETGVKLGFNGKRFYKKIGVTGTRIWSNGNQHE
jgi:hypothetical protein